MLKWPSPFHHPLVASIFASQPSHRNTQDSHAHVGIKRVLRVLRGTLLFRVDGPRQLGAASIACRIARRVVQT